MIAQLQFISGVLPCGTCRIFVVILLVQILCFSSIRAANLQVWTQSIANKVQPTTNPTASGQIIIEGARNSFEAYQIIVTANEGDVSGVNMVASDLKGENGRIIPARKVTFFRQAFIDFNGVDAVVGTKPVPENSPTGDTKIPDPLIPFLDPYSSSPPRSVGAPFAVKKGLNQPVWVDFFIPKSTAPGVYTGIITVTAIGQASVQIPVELNVWNIVLPDMRSVKTYYSMDINKMIDYHQGTWDCSGADCWLDWNARARLIVKRYEQLAHNHRIDTGQMFVPDIGNGCSPPTDWSEYDEAIAPYMRGTYWSNRVPSGRLNAPFTPGADWGFEADCSQAEYTALAKSWAVHLKSKRWFNKSYVYALDEPAENRFADIAKNSKWMQDGDADWKERIFVTTQPTESNVGVLNPAVGIYVVNSPAYDNWNDETSDNYGRKNWPDLFKKGIKLWFYESNSVEPPYPSYATNTLLGMEPRMFKWGSWYEQASGFLYWDVIEWNQKQPWGPNIDYGKTGDGILIYPGHHNGLQKPSGSPDDVEIDGPVPSYRLKAVRAGLQDWALFRLAEQKGVEAYAREQVARAYSQMGACWWEGCKLLNGEWLWRSDDGLMMEIRRNIAQAIIDAS